MKPQTYVKKLDLEPDSEHDQFESGLIAQEIYYDCPELKHLVLVPDGTTPNETKVMFDDPTVWTQIIQTGVMNQRLLTIQDSSPT